MRTISSDQDWSVSPGDGPLAVSDRLRAEQRHAVEFALPSRDRAVSISGAAGTGKTATLRELLRGLMEAGHNVLAVAPPMATHARSLTRLSVPVRPLLVLHSSELMEMAGTDC